MMNDSDPVSSALLARALGRPLRPEDRVSTERLAAAAARLGIGLPRVVVDFYERAGNAPELQAHNSLRTPEALAIEDGHLVFMEENQGVVDWCLRLPLDPRGDPEVWQRVNDAPPEWHSEVMTFSEFIVRNLAWQRGVELEDFRDHGLH